MNDITDFEGEIKVVTELTKKMDEFLSVASHELRTPVTTIKASIQVIQQRLSKKNISTNEILQIINRASKKVNHLAQVVDDLVDVDRIKSGKLELNKTFFLLNDLLTNCIAHLQSVKDQVNISYDNEEQLLIYADQNRIEQVIENLLINAVKYSCQGQPILIKTKLISDKIEVSIKDKGIGIPIDKLPHIFDRFSRVHNNSQSYPGLGLGLFICSAIIHRHEGEIGVESKPGEGSTFWFRLPICCNNAKTH